MRSTDEKTERNKELVLKRLINSKKWTWGELGKLYNIHRHTARDLFKQHVDKYRNLLHNT